MTNTERFSIMLPFKWSQIGRKLLAFTIMTLVFIITAPQDSNYLDIYTRAEYWLIWTALIWACMLFISAVLSNLWWLQEQQIWIRAAAEFMIALLPCATLSAGLTSTMFPWSFEFNIESIEADILFVSPILAAILLEFHGPTEFREVRVPESHTIRNRITFFDRLSQQAGTHLIHIQVTDHYLEVKTPERTEVILLNLKQAAEELLDYEGMQVHRSHWVAFEHIERKYWSDGRLFLALTNGDIVPVSRSFRKNLLGQLSAKRTA